MIVGNTKAAPFNYFILVICVYKIQRSVCITLGWLINRVSDEAGMTIPTHTHLPRTDASSVYIYEFWNVFAMIAKRAESKILDVSFSLVRMGQTSVTPRTMWVYVGVGGKGPRGIPLNNTFGSDELWGMYSLSWSCMRWRPHDGCGFGAMMAECMTMHDYVRCGFGTDGVVLISHWLLGDDDDGLLSVWSKMGPRNISSCFHLRFHRNQFKCGILEPEGFAELLLWSAGGWWHQHAFFRHTFWHGMYLSLVASWCLGCGRCRWFLIGYSNLEPEGCWANNMSRRVWWWWLSELPRLLHPNLLRAFVKKDSAVCLICRITPIS